MDCCICSPLASLYRPPRNSICASCFEGAKCIISFLGEYSSSSEINVRDVTAANSAARTPSHGSTNSSSKPTLSKGVADAFKRLKEMKDKELEMDEKLGFLEGFGAAFKEQLHTDIVIKPGNGPPIPAHKALLAARSQVFKNILAPDECKSSEDSDELSLPELTHDELNSLLHFLYHGHISPEPNNEKHYYSLLLAADKYDIPYLKRYCEGRIMCSLEASNALQVLEVADMCGNTVLKEHAMDVIVKNAESVVFDGNYGDFAMKNAHLCVEITREVLMRMTDGKSDQGL